MFTERESRSAMSLHQGNIENKIYTYNCYKAGLLRQQQKQHDGSLEMHAKTCLKKKLFATSSHDDAGKKENFASRSALEFLQSPIQKRRHVCPNL